MNWFEALLLGEGIPHSILIVAFVIVLGLALGKIKIFGISLGVTWILLVGLASSYFGLTINTSVLRFVQDFGLILFVFSLGLHVGPGFFSSFKKGGLSLNLLAVLLISLTVATTFIIQIITGTPINTMVGVMSGAVTNTPGLGAAQQTITDAVGINDPSVAMGYAVAYPLGVIGVIVSILLLKKIFKVDLKKDLDKVAKMNGTKNGAVRIAIDVVNEAIVGKTISEMVSMIPQKFVVSRVLHPDGVMEICSSDLKIAEGDRLYVVTSVFSEKAVISLIGEKVKMELEDWTHLDTEQLVSRRILVTKSAVNGKSLSELNIRAQYGINVVRVNRAGIDLVATPHLRLQMGDRLTVVGKKESIKQVADLFGNSMKKLREPNLIPIFLGIFLGVVLGSIPIAIPGLPQVVKLGLAGGPLIVAILIAYFGPKLKIITYTTISANMIIREIGISFFLAAVGLGAGKGFVDAVVGGGYIWILYGLIITVVPLTIVSIIARYALKLDFYSIVGLICGAQTNPIALSFSNNTYGGVPQIAVIYATVYPLTMFLRVLVAQIMVL